MLKRIEKYNRNQLYVVNLRHFTNIPYEKKSSELINNVTICTFLTDFKILEESCSTSREYFSINAETRKSEKVIEESPEEIWKTTEDYKNQPTPTIASRQSRQRSLLRQYPL